MTRTWTHETPAEWDAAKSEAFGELDLGLFGLGASETGTALGDEWWKAEEDGELLGFGKLDDIWGDAEILIMVAPKHRRRGIGAFILEKLEGEADHRHLNYVYNVVKPEHPDAAEVMAWLVAHGFEQTADGEYRKHVRGNSPR